MYIFSLLGMELFAYSVVEDDEGNMIFGKDNIKATFESGKEMIWPRDNFNNIFNSMITVFIVIIAEDWNATMYLYVRALDAESGSRFTALFYFISLFVIGNTVMLALFTALLLRKGETNDVETLK